MKKILLTVIAILSGVAALRLAAQNGTVAGGNMHTETSFDVVVHAPAAEAAKLFTPEGERGWAGSHWDPQYLYSSGPTRDQEGAVFTIQHGPLKAVWTVMRRNDVTREYDYSYFIPDLMATTVSVRFGSLDHAGAAAAATTKVHVTYARTALSPQGEPHVRAMTESDQKAGPEWQSAIDKYLAAQTVPAH